MRATHAGAFKKNQEKAARLVNQRTPRRARRKQGLERLSSCGCGRRKGDNMRHLSPTGRQRSSGTNTIVRLSKPFEHRASPPPPELAA